MVNSHYNIKKVNLFFELSTRIVFTCVFLCVLTILFFGAAQINVFAQENADSVELNGDVVEYSVDGNVVTAEGNVVIVHKDAT